MAWQRFFGMLVATCAVTLGALYVALLIIDPFDSVPFSPDWDRYPVSRHSRDYNAVLARRSEYDSAVMGTSTAMLLPPDDLNRLFGGRFVMLGMPAASAFEQMALLRLFRRYRSEIRTLIFGLDRVWCDPNGAARFMGLMVNHPFPDWLYDESPWNDFPPLNRNTIDKAAIQLRALLGLRIRYDRKPDGYWDFTGALHKDNDPASIRRRLYDPHKESLARKRDDGSPAYPDLSKLELALAELPVETQKILFFAPYHYFQLPEPGSDQMAAWEECKARAAAIAEEVPNTLVVDFMIRSRITMGDGNYIDALHYTKPVASELAQMLAAAWHGDAESLAELRLLSRAKVDLARPAWQR